MEDFETIVEILKDQLGSPIQNWLLGAGISFKSNIPLMCPLTTRVKAIINEGTCKKDKEIYQALTEDLDPQSHIEHYLSHLGDLIALSERSKVKSAKLCDQILSTEELRNTHKAIISAIGATVRYGYSNNSGDEIIGSLNNPIVTIEHHLRFVKALFKNRANLESRLKLSFFTTNYDTLLEDALALEKNIVIDGFSGGSIGFWNPLNEFRKKEDKSINCSLYKLHGSVDWHCDQEHGLVRVRYGSNYLPNLSDIMIYPQATKYIETQKDPFAFLFEGFRKALNSGQDNVLIICGYSFGDEHINSEIEAALRLKSNRTTILAFANEAPIPVDEIVINRTLDRWLEDKDFGKRVYVAGKNGIYNNSTIATKSASYPDLSWWTFEGLTNFLTYGKLLATEHEQPAAV